MEKVQETIGLAALALAMSNMNGDITTMQNGEQQLLATEECSKSIWARVVAHRNWPTLNPQHLCLNGNALHIFSDFLLGR